MGQHLIFVSFHFLTLFFLIFTSIYFLFCTTLTPLFTLCFLPLFFPSIVFCFFLFLYLYSLYFFYLYLLSILYHIDTFIYPLSSTAVFPPLFYFQFCATSRLFTWILFLFLFIFLPLFFLFFLPLLGSVFVHCYGTTKSFILKTHGSHDKITILLN